jgi:ADP-dependent NAD(P)H-hydrate dehydratase
MTSIRVTAQFLRAHPLPTHEEVSDKQARGRVLVIGGSTEVPGSALLAGLGALRAGAGILQIATCQSAASHLGLAMPEAMVVPCPETTAGASIP